MTSQSSCSYYSMHTYHTYVHSAEDSLLTTRKVEELPLFCGNSSIIMTSYVKLAIFSACNVFQII